MAAPGKKTAVVAAVAVAGSMVAAVAGKAKAKVVGIENIVADTVVAVGKVVAAAVSVAVIVVDVRY